MVDCIFPINHLIRGNATYDGNFTYYRGLNRSQIDWACGNNNFLKMINGFYIDTDNAPRISDHIPIICNFSFKHERTLVDTINAAKEVNLVVNNHSKVIKRNEHNINIDLMKNILRNELGNIENYRDYCPHNLAKYLQYNIETACTISQKRNTNRQYKFNRYSKYNYKRLHSTTRKKMETFIRH